MALRAGAEQDRRDVAIEGDFGLTGRAMQDSPTASQRPGPCGRQEQNRNAEAPRAQSRSEM